MPTFEHRTEELTLGGLLYSPEQLTALPQLKSRHFHDPDHRVIFAALLTVHAEHPHARGQQLVTRILETTMSPTVTFDRLTGLALACPDVTNTDDEARLVIQQAMRRALADSAAQITDLAEALHPAQGPDYRGLLDTLRRYEANTGPDVKFDLPAAPNGKHSSIEREETLLADLMQQPELAAELDSWFDPEAFTSPNRHEVYRAILAADGLGPEPAFAFVGSDDIRNACSNTGRAGHPVNLDQYSSVGRTDYCAHLATADIPSGSCLEIGRDLMADLTRERGRSPSTPRDQTLHAEALHGEALRMEEAWIRYTAGLPPKHTEHALFYDWAQRDFDHRGPSHRNSVMHPGELTNERIRVLAEQALDRRASPTPAPAPHDDALADRHAYVHAMGGLSAAGQLRIGTEPPR